MKKLVPILALIIIGFALYKNLPGFKAKANELVDKYGGWTQEAINDDPVGFIEHAEKKLNANKKRFTEIRTELAAKKTEVEAKKAETAEKVAFADAASGSFKVAFQQASTTNAWPVSMPADSKVTGEYSETQLKEQVAKLLAQKAAHEKNLGTYESVLQTLNTKDAELSERITNIGGQLAELSAKKIEAEANQLTADADAMMGNINDFVSKTGAWAEELETDNPVRDLDDLMKDAAKASEEAQEPKAVAASNAVDEFLSN